MKAILVMLILLLVPQTAPVPPKVAPDVQAKILKLQLQAARIQASYQTCSTTDWQGNFNKVSVEVQGLVNQAFKDAKLDKKDYELNLDSFEFTKKVPVSPSPTAPAEDKKP